MKRIVVSQNGETNSLQKAVETARATGCKEIFIKAGLYPETTVTLTAEDEGLVIRGEDPGATILSGGKLFTDFQKDPASPFYYCDLPKDGEYDFRFLLANGKYLKKARYPESGKLIHASEWKVAWTSTFGNGWATPPTKEDLTTMIYKNEDLPADFVAENAELSIFHEWDESYVGVASVDRVTKKVFFSTPAFHPPGAFNHHTYVVWNTREGMTSPLSWYFDKTQNRIYIYPDEEMEQNGITAFVPVARSVIQLNEAKNILLENFTAECCTPPLISCGFGAEYLSAAIDGKDCTGITVKNVTVRNSGGTGIKFTGKAQIILNCRTFMLGGAGIWCGINDEYLFVSYEEMEQECSSTIENCTVADIGLDYFSAIGIFARHTNIRSCMVERTPYIGINASGDNAVIENNIIQCVMQQLADGGAIYTIGHLNGTIRGNIVRHMIRTGSAGEVGNGGKISGIYLDEKSGGWLVENNIVSECEYPHLHHMNRPGNVLRNNIACNTKHAISIYTARCEEITMEKNIVKTPGTILFRGAKDSYREIRENTFISGEKQLYMQLQEMYTPTEKIVLELDESNTCICHTL